MQYLQQLKDDLIAQFADVLTPDKVHLFIVNGEMTAGSSDINYIARFLFIDCRSNDPFSLITYVRHWFDKNGRTAPDINFDSEIIDAETYDLTLDIGLMDKIVTGDNGKAHICPPKVWSDAFGEFVAPEVAAAFDKEHP